MKESEVFENNPCGLELQLTGGIIFLYGESGATV